MRYLAWALLCGFSCACLAGEPGQQADWAQRRAQADALQERAAGLRTEADQVYDEAERRCYEDVLVNRCRERARLDKVASYQAARQLDIQARNIELMVRREEQSQRIQDAQDSLPERTFNTRQRVSDTEQAREMQAAQRADAEQRKQREYAEGAARIAQESSDSAERRAEREQRLRDKADKQVRERARQARRAAEEEQLRRQSEAYR